MEEPKNSNKIKCLFVCLGNICRSPAAEGIFSAIAERNSKSELFKIDSAGTYGGHSSEKADPRMRKAASARGYDLTSRSRKIDTSDFEKFDIILAMDDSNYQNLLRLAPDIESARKVQKFATYLTSHDIDHVPDPYYEGADGFEYVLDILEDGCENLFKQLIQES